MNTTTSPTFSSVLTQSAKFALQWRLLLLWIVILLIPTLLMTMPIWQVLSAQLNHTVQAEALAHHLPMNAIYDLVGSMMTNKIAFHNAAMVGLLLTLLLSPFLSGAIVTAARSTSTLPIGKLMHGGLAEYWRMFRMLLWAIIPFGVFGAIIAGVMHWSDGVAEKAILQSDADFASHVATIVMLILLIIADASVDAGRAQFVHSTVRRSAIKAGWTGLKLVFKRPLSTLGLYLVISIIGLIAAAVFGLLRKNIGDVSGIGFVLGVILSQCIVAATAWMKCARLYALAAASKP